jgi:lysozyme
MRLTIIKPTIFKKNSTLPSDRVAATDQLSIAAGQSFDVLAYRDAGNNHWAITFTQNLGPNNWNTWCVFKGHATLSVPDVSPTTTPQKISGAGLDLIKRYEGFRENAYLCPAGVWTIGYGSTHGVRPGDRIDENSAEARLRDEVRMYEKAVAHALKVPATQNQFDALVSLAYNIGTSAIVRSSAIKLHNQKQFEKAADAILLWRSANGKVLPGLVRRREEERSLYLRESQ